MVTPTPVCACAPFDEIPETEDESELIYFDKKYIGNITTETILNTIEFLESFVQKMEEATTTTTRKPRRKIKNKVTS